MEKHSTSLIGSWMCTKSRPPLAEPAPAGPRGRFVGTVGPTLAELLKSLKSLGRPRGIIHRVRAGPCGYDGARARSRGYACEVIALRKSPADRPIESRRTGVIQCDWRNWRAPAAGQCDGSGRARNGDPRSVAGASGRGASAACARHQLKAMFLRHGHRYGRSS